MDNPALDEAERLYYEMTAAVDEEKQKDIPYVGDEQTLDKNVVVVLCGNNTADYKSFNCK